jgi:hypothetical protein
MARAVAFGGASHRDLSMRFGLHVQYVGQICNSNLFKAEVARLQKLLEEGALDIQKELNLRVPRAIEILDEELYQPERSASRTKAAFEILDRTGYSKQREPSKQGDTYNIVYLTPLPGESPLDAKKRIDKIKRERALIEESRRVRLNEAQSEELSEAGGSLSSEDLQGPSEGVGIESFFPAELPAIPPEEISPQALETIFKEGD